MKKICFCVVFNHRYDTNIEKLISIYGTRFSNIVFLIPFYDGDRKDVITVFESSYYFEGYFAQALERIYNPDFEHYIFISDDVLLNPEINEGNIQSRLKLDVNSSYIPNISSITSMYSWIPPQRLIDQEEAFSQKGASYIGEIPTLEEALERTKPLRLGIRKWSWKRLLTEPKSIRCYRFLFNKNKNLPYPLAYGDSDFFIISGNDIRYFCRICGIFAAMKLFAECAVPTAMALCCQKIRFEKNSRLQNINLNGTNGAQELLELYQADIKKLYKNWDKRILRYHPIKLSKWKYDEV